MGDQSLSSIKSYRKHDKDGFIHRNWINGTGPPDHGFDGRPIIGIANTGSERVPCQTGLRDLAECEAGGQGGRSVPIEFPAMSLPETPMWPTAMLFRNLLAMEVEDSMWANLIDGEGRDNGSGADVWRFSEAVRAGEMSLAEFTSAQSGMSRLAGDCNATGTASTMATLTEALGKSLRNNVALPTVGASSAEVTRKCH